MGPLACAKIANGASFSRPPAATLVRAVPRAAMQCESYREFGSKCGERKKENHHPCSHPLPYPYALVPPPAGHLVLSVRSESSTRTRVNSFAQVAQPEPFPTRTAALRASHAPRERACGIQDRQSARRASQERSRIKAKVKFAPTAPTGLSETHQWSRRFAPRAPRER